MVTVRGGDSGSWIMEVDKGGYWEFLLGAKLRMTHGDGFQELFNDFMLRVHGDDFTPVKPHGALGDGGMDGALGNSVFQCYGAENGHVIDAARVCKKMTTDFDRACETTPSMKKWFFAHNLVDGVARPVVDTLAQIKERAIKINIEAGFFGLHGFRTLLRKMSEDDRTAVLGVRAQDDMMLARLPNAVNNLVSALIEEIKPVMETYENRSKVPRDKLQLNNISRHWTHQFEYFLMFSPISRAVMRRLGGEKQSLLLPSFFRLRYEELKHEGMTSSQILNTMRALLAGNVRNLDDDLREFAAMTILADLFESCVIFEETRQEANQDEIYDLAD
ncbi:hypothetical protein D3C80_767890 [compost metagenome]